MHPKLMDEVLLLLLQKTNEKTSTATRTIILGSSWIELRVTRKRGYSLRRPRDTSMGRRRSAGLQQSRGEGSREEGVGEP
jgi:hypothetical protein